MVRRNADLQELTGVNDQLDEVDRRANELNHRAMALLGDTEELPWKPDTPAARRVWPVGWIGVLMAGTLIALRAHRTGLSRLAPSQTR